MGNRINIGHKVSIPNIAAIDIVACQAVKSPAEIKITPSNRDNPAEKL